MTFRERMVATFRKEPLDRILWQPRLEHWYTINKQYGTLPERYRDRELLDLYDDLGASVRAYSFFSPTIRVDEGTQVKVAAVETEREVVTTWETPVGALRQVEIKTDLSRLIREFRVKTVADLQVAEYILRERRVSFDPTAFQSADQQVGARGAPTVWLPRISLQRMFIELMGFETTIYALHDRPREIEHFVGVIEETDDAYYDAVKTSPIEIINLGDNVHSDMLSPPLFERYILSYYKRRTRELHEAGKYAHSHWDGYIKPLLPYMKRCGLDGYEGVTPLPQGDVTLEEIQEHLGDLMLIDGIPATHFLPQTSEPELVEFTRRILDMFSPNIILGISDELPPGGDIERVHLVSEIVADYQP